MFVSRNLWTRWRNYLRASAEFAGFEVYTDGSYKEGRGSWAYVIVQKGVVLQEAAACVRKTSSNRMEFQAAIEALSFLPPDSDVRLYTDSRIMIENVTVQTEIWKSLGWKKKNQQEIPHVDLFKILAGLNALHRIHWSWVKAHSGVAHNERCDQLCVQARQTQKSYSRN